MACAPWGASPRKKRLRYNIWMQTTAIPPGPAEAFDLNGSEETLARLTEYFARFGDLYRVFSPTRGVYKGTTAVRSELAVGVSVGPAVAGTSGEAPPFVPWMSREAPAPLGSSDSAQQQQQQ